jgi:broad specificity phosphatase PhoE
MTRRLLLVRHGHSAHTHDGSWIDLPRAKRFEQLYDAASIRDDSHPPAELLALSRAAAVLMASDLPRAVASIRRLAPDREPVISPLLRELYFEIPSWGPRLPLLAWDALFHAWWTVRMPLATGHPELQRARAAAAGVDANAAGLTIAVTHGGFRRLLARQLTARGWTISGPTSSFANWSAWELTHDAEAGTGP